ncbi:MAG TPA: hypothetical protein ENL05_00420 [Candidatus Moranbacteria bacterium]|nr:hypothetical protein [Candidatus Moranbacteria bacterium]
MYQTVEKILLEFNPEKSNLLLALKKINATFGYISEKSAQKIADYFSLPLSQVFETASFHNALNVKKPPRLVIKICSGANCALNNSFQTIKEVENYFKIKADREDNPEVKLETVSCLGRCGEGPVMMVNGKVYTKVTKDKIYEILKEWV